MSKLPDRYDIEARYMPAILSSAPFIALGFFYISAIDVNFWSKLFAVSFGGTTLGLALYKLAEQSCRLAGKYLETLMFSSGLYFPTTSLLINNDRTLSPERKLELRKKILTLTGVDLSGISDDTKANRRRIHEVIGQIRKKFFKKNEMILQRNIQFGFFRNLVGGTILAIPASLVSILLGIMTHSVAAVKVSLVLLIFYLIILFFALPILRFLAKQYALTLFDELLGS